MARLQLVRLAVAVLFCLCGASYGIVGKTWVGNVKQVGPNRRDEPKTVTVIYRRCFYGTARKVVLSVRSERRWSDTFNATLLEVFEWGFRADVRRTDVERNDWGQSGVYLRWLAYFGTPTFQKNPCNNGGVCSNSKRGHTCNCTSQFDGDYCDRRLVNCYPNPCYLGNCTELVDDYTCSCPPGQTGKDCTNMYVDGQIDDLFPDPQSKSSKISVVYESCKSEPAYKVELSVNDGRWGNLNAKVSGVFQWGFDVEISNKDESQAENDADPTDIRWRAFFHSTESVQNPCQNGATCQNTKNGTVCDCPFLTTGKLCETNITYCYFEPCGNGGTCIPTNTTYICECPPFYSGDRCNERPEVRQDITVSLYNMQWAPEGRIVDVAYARCFTGVAAYVTATARPSRYTGETYNVTVMEIHPWGFRALLQRTNLLENKWRQNIYVAYKAMFESGEYINNPCINASRCRNIVGDSRKCHCNPGYSGEFCNIALNHCYPHPCNTGQCIEMDGGYKCNCSEGTIGKHCEIVTKLTGSLTVYGNADGSKDKVVQILYEGCHNGTASRVTISIRSQLRFPARFKGVVDEIFPWGFRVIVKRTDRPQRGWQQSMTLTWTAFLDDPESMEIPCYNNATCRNTVERPLCNCKPQFGGEFCQTPLKHCVNHTCHTGSCVELPDSHKCLCPHGYAGDNCSMRIMQGEQYHEFRPNDDLSQNRSIVYPGCKKDNATMVELTLQDEVKGLFAVKVMEIHQWGFVVNLMKLNNFVNAFSVVIYWKAYFDDENYLENPCQNEGRCVNSQQGISCRCSSVRYTGSRCETYMPFCASDPCKNNGTCLEGRWGHVCNCTDEYQGSFCTQEPVYSQWNLRLPQKYLPEPPYRIVVNVSYYRCFTGMAKRVKVTALRDYRDFRRTYDSKLLAIHSWGFQLAIVKTGDIGRDWGTFDVLVSYEATFDTVRLYHNPCGFHSHHCTNNDNVRNACACHAGWTGDRCQTELVHCYPNPCNRGSCVEEENGYKCDCPSGVTGVNCTNGYIGGRQSFNTSSWASDAGTVNVIYDKCKSENATDVEVSVAGQASPLVDVKLAEIHSWGFAVAMTRRGDVKIDWSVLPIEIKWKAYFETLNYDQNPCENQGTCSNLVDGQVCSCEPRSTGQHCETVLPHCTLKPCLNDGLCEDVNDWYKCYCKPGYGGNLCEQGVRTEIVNFPPNLYSSTTGKTVIFDSCLAQTPFKVELELLNLGNQQMFFTPSTYYVYRNGFHLRLHKTYRARNVQVAEYRVRYKAYFATTNYTENPCKNNGTCGVLDRDRIQCNCTEGFRGDLCEKEIIKCSTNPCKNGGNCTDTSRGHTCQCKAGYVGSHCSDVEISGNRTLALKRIRRDHRTINVVYGKCYSVEAKEVRAQLYINDTVSPQFSVSSFSPKPWGFSAILRRTYRSYDWRQPGMVLRFSATFASSKLNEEICANGGRCENVVDGPRCHCTTGYIGKRCKIVDRCYPNPCYNGGTCANDEKEGFTCQCEKGFVGVDCSIDTTGFADIIKSVSNATTANSKADIH